MSDVKKLFSKIKNMMWNLLKQVTVARAAAEVAQQQSATSIENILNLILWYC